MPCFRLPSMSSMSCFAVLIVLAVARAYPNDLSHPCHNGSNLDSVLAAHLPGEGGDRSLGLARSDQAGESLKHGKFVAGRITPEAEAMELVQGHESTRSRRRAVSASPRLAAALHFETTPAGVAKWQTQRTQNAPPARACGFESRSRHPRMNSISRLDHEIRNALSVPPPWHSAPPIAAPGAMARRSR